MCIHCSEGTFARNVGYRKRLLRNRRLYGSRNGHVLYGIVADMQLLSATMPDHIIKLSAQRLTRNEPVEIAMLARCVIGVECLAFQQIREEEMIKIVQYPLHGYNLSALRQRMDDY